MNEEDIRDISKKTSESVSRLHNVEYKIFNNGELETFFSLLLNNISVHNHENYLFNFSDYFKVPIYKKDKFSSLKNIYRNIRKIFKYTFTKNIFKNYMCHNCYHYSIYCEENSFSAPNLSVKYIGTKKFEVDENIRNRFYCLLVESGVKEKIASEIKIKFPMVYIEGFKDLENLTNSLKLKFKKIYATPYGLHEDPLLSLYIVKNKIHLVYVQHGGNYGFKYAINEALEMNSGIEFISWGIGKNSVYPTRFKSHKRAGESRLDRKVAILSHDINESNLKKFIKFCSNNKFEMVIHPRSPENIINFSDETQKIYIGIKPDRIFEYDFVLYDSLKHTLMYNSLLNYQRFKVVDDSSPLPHSERTRQLYSLLEKSNCLCRMDELSMNKISNLFYKVNTHNFAAFQNCKDIVTMDNGVLK